MPIDRWMDNEDVVHICDGIWLSHEKNEVTSLEAIRTDLEIVILSEGSQTETNTWYCLSVDSKIKKNTNEFISKMERDPQTQGTNLWLPKWRGGLSSVLSLSRVHLCDPMDCSSPELPVHHQLPEFACRELTQEIPPMARSWGEILKGTLGQVFRDSTKLPPALTLKMISVFLMPASIDYSLISVTQAEGLPHLFPDKNRFRTLINKFPSGWYFMRLSRVKGVF